MNRKQWIAWTVMMFGASVALWAILEAVGVDDPLLFAAAGCMMGLPWGLYGGDLIKRIVK